MRVDGPVAFMHMPKGETASIRSHGEGALTACVTFRHWRTARVSASPRHFRLPLQIIFS